MEKQLGLAHKMGGAQSLGISNVGPTVLATLMESQIWHQLACCLVLWAYVLERRQGPLLTLMPDTSVPPCIPLVPFNLLPPGWSSEGVSLSRCVQLWVL